MSAASGRLLHTCLDKLVASFEKFSDPSDRIEHHHVNDGQRWNEWIAELRIRYGVGRKEFGIHALRLEFLPRIELLDAYRIDVTAGVGFLADAIHTVLRFQR